MRFELLSEEEIANISAPRPQIKKVRTLCFIKLKKLKKIKCPYFFIFGPGAEILAISSSDNSSNLTLLTSNKEMVIFRLLGPN